MNELSIMERFADPALFETLTFGEKSTGALITTLMGIGITFTILVSIWGLIVLMGKFTAEKKTVIVADKSETKPVSGLVATTETVTEAGTPAEVIAAIAAAISAFEGGGSSSNLLIRKISRVTGQTTAWGTAGSADAINSRRF